jgi:DNA-binding CsgD family transcriptional regulator
VQEVKRLASTGLLHREIAARVGTNKATVGKILTGRLYTGKRRTSRKAGVPLPPGVPAFGKPPVPDEVKQAAREARSRGESITSIAERLPISLMQVSRVVRDVRPERVVRRPVSDVTQARMSESQLAKHGVWTEEAFVLLETNMTDKEIGERLGVHKNTVRYHRMKRTGAAMNQGSAPPETDHDTPAAALVIGALRQLAASSSLTETELTGRLGVSSCKRLLLSLISLAVVRQSTGDPPKYGIRRDWL